MCAVTDSGFVPSSAQNRVPWPTLLE